MSKPRLRIVTNIPPTPVQHFYETVAQDLLNPDSPLSELLTSTLFLWTHEQLEPVEQKQFDAMCEAEKPIQEILGFAAEHIQDYFELSQEVLLMKIGELEAQTLADGDEDEEQERDDAVGDDGQINQSV